MTEFSAAYVSVVVRLCVSVRKCVTVSDSACECQ